MIAGLSNGTWLTVANYATAVALCLWAAQRHARSSRTWTLLAGVLVLLLVNKLLGLEYHLASAGRTLAKADGLYDTRRLYQAAAIAGLLAMLPYALRSAWRQVARHAFALQLATACLTALVTFVVARTLSFHYLDKLLALGPSFIKVNGLIENAIVCGASTGAILSLRLPPLRRHLRVSRG